MVEHDGNDTPPDAAQGTLGNLSDSDDSVGTAYADTMRMNQGDDGGGYGRATHLAASPGT